MCLGTLLRASADFQQSQGLYAEARRTLQALLNHGHHDDSDREFVLAKLALVSAFAGADDAEKLADALPSLHAISEQHLAALEDEIQQSASTYRRKPKPDAQKKQEQQPKQEVKARKKKRKPRYPKDFNPKNPGPPPDPERWLPRYERSYYSKGMMLPSSQCSSQCQPYQYELTIPSCQAAADAPTTVLQRALRAWLLTPLLPVALDAPRKNISRHPSAILNTVDNHIDSSILLSLFYGIPLFFLL